MTDDESDASVRETLLDLLISDSEKGEGLVRALDVYLRLFPGHEATVRETYEFFAHGGPLESDASVRETLLDLLISDSEKGEGLVRALDVYLRLFPGQKATVRETYEFFAHGGPLEYGDYRILTQSDGRTVLLGEGGQAKVYEAVDGRDGRHVALKVLELGQLESAHGLDRFRREAQVTRALDRAEICPIYDVWKDGELPYIAMKLLRGKTLAAHIQEAAKKGSDRVLLPASAVQPRGPDPQAAVPRILRCFEKVLCALHAAHEAGIIHRDIKPANLMITLDGEPVILDFGIARDTDPSAPKFTQTQDSLGTPPYMAPEQLAVVPAKADRRTDVWSAGAALYETLTLRPPFKATESQDLSQAIQAVEPDYSRALTRSFPKYLRLVIENALDKDLNRRYPTALAFAQDLRSVRRGERPQNAKPMTIVRRIHGWRTAHPRLAPALAIAIPATLFGVAVTAGIQFHSQKDLLAEFKRLGAVSRLADLLAESERLWPAVPETREQLPETKNALGDWLKRAELLTDVSEINNYCQARDAMQVSLKSREYSDNSEQSELKFRYEQTARLVEGLTTLCDDDPFVGAVASVRERLHFAETIECKSLTRADRAKAWADAVKSIETECPLYHGLRIKPQLGLVPIGIDRKSGLWEFAHIETTKPGIDSPVPNGDGLVMNEDMGLVFVLIPGGKFRMGARRPTDEEKAAHAKGATYEPDVDVLARDGEFPVHEITLDPFFISKYEMTQAQWLRKSGHNPSEYPPARAFADKKYAKRLLKKGPWSEGGSEFVEYCVWVFADALLSQQPPNKVVTLVHPVENVRWEDCDRLLYKLGLVLPTEAQWEYASRAGTTTPWLHGFSSTGLEYAANVLDETYNLNYPDRKIEVELWNDHYEVHAPVGSFDSNAFGLYDMQGNVSEWCRDIEMHYAADNGRPGDGLRNLPDPIARLAHSVRGSNFHQLAWDARSSARDRERLGAHTQRLGLRPARSLVQ